MEREEDVRFGGVDVGVHAGEGGEALIDEEVVAPGGGVEGDEGWDGEVRGDVED